MLVHLARHALLGQKLVRELLLALVAAALHVGARVAFGNAVLVAELVGAVATVPDDACGRLRAPRKMALCAFRRAPGQNRPAAD